MHNRRRYPSSNWHKIDQKCGSEFGILIWRDRKKRNIGAQLHSFLYTTATK